MDKGKPAVRPEYTNQSLPGSEVPLNRVDVVLPAGGRISGEFAREAGAEIKALIELNGRTILQRTITAFRETGRVANIVVIGPDEALAEARACGVEGALAEGATGPQNIFHGLEWLRERQSGAVSPVVIAATDLPFLTADSITAFLDACPENAHVAVPVMTEKDFQARFPGSQNIYVPLREGPMTVGSVFRLDRDVLLRNRVHLENLFAARKSQWQMARLVGGRIALQLLTKRLAIPTLESRCAQIMGCTGGAVRNAPPELGFDIDQPEEYRYVVQRFLQQETDLTTAVTEVFGRTAAVSREELAQ